MEYPKAVITSGKIGTKAGKAEEGGN